MPGIRALKTDVARLSLPGGRVVGSHGHQLVEQYLLRRFEELDDRGVHAAVIMDLVGHDVLVPFDYLTVNRIASGLGRACPRLRKWDIPFPVLRDLLFITGAESHPALPDLLTELKTPDGSRFGPFGETHQSKSPRGV